MVAHGVGWSRRVLDGRAGCRMVAHGVGWSRRVMDSRPQEGAMHGEGGTI